MSTINDSDLLLVERNGNLHQITYDQMSTLNDDDILLVERGGVQYKVEAQYVSTGPNGVILPSVEVLTPLNGAGLNDGQPYTPMSSAYVSTDSTPIYHRYFPELITTVSGGTWFNENNIFDGLNYTYAELRGVADAVSQAVFTAPSTWVDGETTVSAANAGGGAGGTIEVLDASDTVLRTYTLPGTLVETAIGIVRIGNKIRFTASGQNIGLQICTINRAPTDYVITGRVTLEFADDTDLDKMVAPIIQTDENGNVKIPTTSTVDSTTTIPGVNASMQIGFVGPGNTKTYTAHDDPVGSQIVPTGPRMTWAKIDSNYSGIISDNVTSFGAYLEIDSSNGRHDGGPLLRDYESTYVQNYRWNRQGYQSYITEHAAAPKVLDIVTWTGNGLSIRQIPHNLGCQPGFIVVKQVDASGEQWYSWHIELQPDQYMHLNQGSNPASHPGVFPAWPTKDSFFVGSNGGVNGDNKEYVAYIYAADTPGKVKCGRYSGLGGSGQFTALSGTDIGFAWCKNIQGGDPWYVVNNSSSINGHYWQFNSSSSFYSSNLNIHSNTGKFRFYSSAEPNQNSQAYLYMAVARDLTGPNSTQLNLLSGQDLEYFSAGTEITSNASASGSNISFGSVTYTGNAISNGIVPYTDGQYWFDTRYQTANKYLCWVKATNISYPHVLFDSERRVDTYLRTDGTDPEVVDFRAITQGSQGLSTDGSSYVNASGKNYIAFCFLAAPQFFDIQKYASSENNPSTLTVNHDLGADLGFIMIKNVKTNTDWFVWHSSLPTHYYLKLNSWETPSYQPGSILSNITDTSFDVKWGGNRYNSGKDFMAYMFAKDTPYVKCGSYTATAGTTVTNVGFKPRWVMIKNTDSYGNWFILDKKMIGSGQHLVADLDERAQTNFTYSFSSTGFEVVEQGSSGISEGGDEYIYIAIADESEGHPPSPPSSSTVLEDPDVNGAVLKVNAESFDVGATASGSPLEASITSVAGSDGNNLIVDGTTGTWLPGLYAKGSETTIDAPGPDEITFTSQNQGTPAFSGVDATLSSRTWTLESGTTATGPWTVVDSYVDYDVLNSQTGATPWTSNKPNLTPNTFYRVKVQYNSTNAESVESVYNTFKTGDA